MPVGRGCGCWAACGAGRGAPRLGWARCCTGCGGVRPVPMMRWNRLGAADFGLAIGSRLCVARAEDRGSVSARLPWPHAAAAWRGGAR
ncbi:MAG: hypothetical protein WDN69_15710 [Aliidongia sp.]